MERHVIEMNPRHIACKLCRERKVRCPGQQPTCDKCRRAGEECVYIPQQRPLRTTSTSLSETVEALQKRLNEAEILILNMSGHMSSTTAVPSPYGSGWPIDQDFSAFAPSTLSGPSIPPSGSATVGQQELIFQPPGQNLSKPVSACQRAAAGGSGFQDSGSMDFDESLMEVYPQLELAFSHESNGQGQTVMQLSCQGPSSSPTANSTLVPPRGTTTSETERTSQDTAAAAAILDPFAGYCSSVIRREAEVAGLATAVADYVAWMRNVPSTGAPPVTTPVYQQMLENIEIRARELVEISQKQHDAPLRDLLTALRGDSAGGDGAMAARVAGLEADLQRQMREHTAFFRTQYNACRFLKEQMEKRPA